MRTMGQIAILAALAALTSGHASVDRSSSPQGTDPSAPAQSLVVTNNGGSYGLILGVDQPTYKVAGASAAPPRIHAALSLFNHTGAPIAFAIAGQQYEWRIVNASGIVVWDYAKGRAFPRFMTNRTLTDKGLMYSYDVPLQSQDGTPLAPGRYTLRGQLTSTLNLSAEVGFTVTK